MNNRLLLLLSCTYFMMFPLLAAKKATTDVTPFLGYRHDNLKWTINNGANFQWKNLNFIDYGVRGKTTLKDRYIIKYDLGLSNLLSGHLNDNQYLIPGGASTSSSFKGWGLAFRPNLGFGYKFKPNRWFNISPQLGYSYDLIYINNNKRTGPFTSVKDTIQWQGPWTGFDATAKIRRWSVNFGAFYHVAFYRNTGNWKVPPVATKNTFHQHGTGQGVSGRLGFGYEVAKSLTLGAETDVNWRRVNSGRDSRTFTTGVTTKSKLKSANWNSYDTRVILTKTF